MSVLRGAPSWAIAARDLYLVAMVVFVLNIGIGILNGADAVEFDRNQLLTHVHAGTIGWLTLTIVASSFLMFRSADRRLMLALAILVPIYVAAFYTGSFALRAAGGTLLLVAIAWLLVWIWRQFLAGERSLPRLAVVLGLTSFGYGAVIGVLLQVQFALGVTILSGNEILAHASAMTFAYLVLVSFGLSRPISHDSVGRRAPFSVYPGVDGTPERAVSDCPSRSRRASSDDPTASRPRRPHAPLLSLPGILPTPLTPRRFRGTMSR